MLGRSGGLAVRRRMDRVCLGGESGLLQSSGLLTSLAHTAAVDAWNAVKHALSSERSISESFDDLQTVLLSAHMRDTLLCAILCLSVFLLILALTLFSPFTTPRRMAALFLLVAEGLLCRHILTHAAPVEMLEALRWPFWAAGGIGLICLLL